MHSVARIGRAILYQKARRAPVGAVGGGTMRAYKTEFIELALEIGVLKFGQFKLKSGRISPYFFNSGLFNTGYAVAKLGRYYAAAAKESGIECDVLFGPAYKGIPLVALTAKAGVLGRWRNHWATTTAGILASVFLITLNAVLLWLVFTGA